MVKMTLLAVSLLALSAQAQQLQTTTLTAQPVPSSQPLVTGFNVQPQACIAKGAQSCSVDLLISWHSNSPLCLNKQQQPGRALVCGSDINHYSLNVTIDSNLVLELRDSQHQLVSSKTIKYLQQTEYSALPERRLRWSIF
ncbi:DUF3019 domain-containing protein [Rheinheimera sp. 4Y26]|uniref:DUF3019 domain-containing protein n=1 Tax=Rheinheimera sp. 4Y26 TaxID=2977811 RepID=UPI0021B13E76|nr:DUF3019 domain-containing protein [Rheinheimera sp. 4Y26]MCT6698945.1 DUF3019 domain-containing protein [Rheinheimera sp. 4Y26]